MSGTATTAARISSGGATMSPKKMTTAISAMRRPAAVASKTSALTSTGVGWSLGEASVSSVVLMAATLTRHAVRLVRVRP